MRIGPSLSITGVNSVTPEAIIRSLGPAAWYRPGVGVTGTLTASNWADQSGNGRDLAQGTAGNQPIYLPYSGTAYGYLPGVAGNYFSTPDSVANSITGDIDIRVKCAADDWTPAGVRILACKFSSYAFYGLSTGLGFEYMPSGGGAWVNATSSAATGITDGTSYWVRVTYASATGKINYYKSADGISWAAVGTEQTVTSGAMDDTANAVYVGTGDASDNLRFIGKIYRAQIYNGIDGTLAVDFDPSRFVETSTNGTTATMSTGEVWTLNSTGAYPATIVKSSQILFGGVDEYLKTAAFTLNQPETVYIVFKQVAWANTKYVFDGDSNDSGTLIQYTAGQPDLSIYAGGSVVGPNSALVLGAYGIASVVFNGASSSLTINAGTPVTGNAGSANMGGLTLGSYASGAIGYSNIIVKEVLIFSAAHTAAQRALMQQALNSMHRCY